MLMLQPHIQVCENLMPVGSMGNTQLAVQCTGMEAASMLSAQIGQTIMAVRRFTTHVVSQGFDICCLIGTAQLALCCIYFASSTH